MGDKAKMVVGRIEIDFMCPEDIEVDSEKLENALSGLAFLLDDLVEELVSLPEGVEYEAWGEVVG